MDTEGILTFWGVRGSIPAPGIDTIIFGGNTSCVSVEYEDYIFIFDAGSGIRELGQHLMERDDITVTPFRLTHPNAALGYLLQIQEVRIAYVSDHEHEPGKISQNVFEMVQGVEVLIHDAQYSREELASGKRNWGHSAWEDVVDLALESQVKHLFLFHHDPDATDEQLNERQFLAQQLFPNTTVAREGLRIPLSRFIEEWV